jgi:HEAT repeat protein
MLRARSAVVNSKRLFSSTVVFLSLLGSVVVNADGDPVPMLLDKLQNSDRYLIRTQAAAVLGRIGDPRAEQALITRLDEDSSYAVRGAAAGALGHLGGGRVVGPLFKALGDEDPVVQQIARKALLSVKGPGVTEALRLQMAEGNSSEQDIAMQRLLGLCREGDSDAAQGLLDELPQAKNSSQIIASLKQLPDDKRLTLALKALKADEAIQRITAVQLLDGHNQDVVLQSLITAYNHPGEEESVKVALRKSLRSRRAQLDVAKLIADSKSEDRNIQTRAIRLLALVDNEDALRNLLALLDAKEVFVQSSVALAMADADLRVALPQIKDLRRRESNPRLQSVLDAVISKLSR